MASALCVLVQRSGVGGHSTPGQRSRVRAHWARLVDQLAPCAGGPSACGVLLVEACGLAAGSCGTRLGGFYVDQM